MFLMISRQHLLAILILCIIAISTVYMYKYGIHLTLYETDEEYRLQYLLSTECVALETNLSELDLLIEDYTKTFKRKSQDYNVYRLEIMSKKLRRCTRLLNELCDIYEAIKKPTADDNYFNI